MKLWITGGSGLVGKHLAKLCCSLSIPHIATSQHDIDITQEGRVLHFTQEMTPSHIINCAAYTHVDLAETHKEKAYAVNAQGARHVAQAAKRYGAKLVQISTNYVFDGTLPLYHEEATCHPINMYGKSKWEGEKYVQQLLPNACIIRTSWVFGHGGAHFISNLVEAFKNRRVVKAVSDQMASLTYVEDLCFAILMLRDKEGVFHFSNLGKTSRYEIASFLLERCKKLKFPIECKTIEPALSHEFKTEAPRPLSSGLNIDKYARTIHAPRTWQEALKEYASQIAKR